MNKNQILMKISFFWCKLERSQKLGMNLSMMKKKAHIWRKMDRNDPDRGVVISTPRRVSSFLTSYSSVISILCVLSSKPQCEKNVIIEFVFHNQLCSFVSDSLASCSNDAVLSKVFKPSWFECFPC